MFNSNLKKTLTILLILTFISIISFNVKGEEEKKRVAVLPFRVNNINVDGVSSYQASEIVAKMLTNSLIKTQKFTVVEYSKVMSVLNELGLDEAPVEEENQKKVAEKLGVEAIIVGWINEFEISYGGGNTGSWYGYSLDVDSTGGKVELEADLLDSSTVEVLKSINEKGSDSDSSVGVGYDYHYIDLDDNSVFYDTVLGHATQEAVDKVAEEVEKSYDKIKSPPEGVTVTATSLPEGLVADVSDKEITINIGENDGVKAGDRFNILRVTKEITDPDTGEVIKEIYEEIGQIIIFEVGDKWSTGNVVNLNSNYNIEVKDIVKKAEK